MGGSVSANFTVTSNNQVYVYVRGHLVMKRWLETGQSKVFYVG